MRPLIAISRHCTLSAGLCTLLQRLSDARIVYRYIKLATVMLTLLIYLTLVFRDHGREDFELVIGSCVPGTLEYTLLKRNDQVLFLCS